MGASSVVNKTSPGDRCEYVDLRPKFNVNIDDYDVLYTHRGRGWCWERRALPGTIR